MFIAHCIEACNNRHVPGSYCIHDTKSALVTLFSLLLLVPLYPYTRAIGRKKGTGMKNGFSIFGDFDETLHYL